MLGGEMRVVYRLIYVLLMLRWLRKRYAEIHYAMFSGNNVFACSIEPPCGEHKKSYLVVIYHGIKYNAPSNIEKSITCRCMSIPPKAIAEFMLEKTDISASNVITLEEAINRIGEFPNDVRKLLFDYALAAKASESKTGANDFMTRTYNVRLIKAELDEILAEHAPSA